jgi:small subunit ribosomal protein S21
MPSVTRKFPHETIESMLRRFKKAVDKSKVLQDLREHEFYEPPSLRRKKEKNIAIRRRQKQLMDEQSDLRELRKGTQDKECQKYHQT